MSAVNTDEKRDKRGRFGAGNSGRPKGARNRTTLAAEALLEGEAESLTKAAIEAALGGDMTAIRICLDRVIPAIKSRRVSLDLPQANNVADIDAAFGAVFRQLTDGKISIDEAQNLAAFLELRRKSLETAELERRIAELERKR